MNLCSSTYGKTVRESASSSSNPFRASSLEQRGVLGREPVALLGDVVGRPLDVLARLQRGDVADQRRVRDASDRRASSP